MTIRYINKTNNVTLQGSTMHSILRLHIVNSVIAAPPARGMHV